MIGKLLSIGPLLGMAYLAAIMWWLTGYTPIDLINAIYQPLIDTMEVISSINF